MSASAQRMMSFSATVSSEKKISPSAKTTNSTSSQLALMIGIVDGIANPAPVLLSRAARTARSAQFPAVLSVASMAAGCLILVRVPVTIATAVAVPMAVAGDRRRQDRQEASGVEQPALRRRPFGP